MHDPPQERPSRNNRAHICLGHFAKGRVCVYAEGYTSPRFKVADLINFLKVESYIGKKINKEQQRQRVDAKIKVSLQKCFRF